MFQLNDTIHLILPFRNTVRHQVILFVKVLITVDDINDPVAIEFIWKLRFCVNKQDYCNCKSLVCILMYHTVILKWTVT